MGKLRKRNIYINSEPASQRRDCFRKKKERTKQDKCNEKFKLLFGMFFEAVDHEVGNSLVAVRESSIIKKTDLKEIEDLVTSYVRILQMKNIICYGTGSFEDVFSEDEKRMMNLEDGSGELDLDAAKRILLIEIQEFRILLKKLEKKEAEDPHFKKTCRFGNMLCSALQKILLDDFDFKSELFPRKIGNSRWRGCLRKDIEEASRYSSCDYKITYCPKEFSEKSVNGNPMFLSLILTNIFSNAKKALETKKEEPEIEIAIFRNRKNGKIGIECRDRGCGMSKKTMEKLNNGVKTTTKKINGSHGIGFSYCRNLACKMGGKLYVKKSISGIGTKVVLELNEAKQK